MKDAWYLVSNHEEISGSQTVKFYGKRWTIGIIDRNNAFYAK